MQCSIVFKSYHDNSDEHLGLGHGSAFGFIRSAFGLRLLRLAKLKLIGAPHTA